MQVINGRYSSAAQLTGKVVSVSNAFLPLMIFFCVFFGVGLFLSTVGQRDSMNGKPLEAEQPTKQQ